MRVIVEYNGIKQIFKIGSLENWRRLYSSEHENRPSVSWA